MSFDSLSTGYLTEEERKDVHKSLYETNFKSGLKVFSDHNGFINGELHTFVGPKGSGKSTWSKTIISEMIYNGKSPLLYISEERKDKYLKNINVSIMKMIQDEEKLQGMMENIIVLSELDEKFGNDDMVFDSIKEIVQTCDMDILIFDNFTTSFLSEMNIGKQSANLRRFKALADELNIPVIVFFHTGKGADSKKLDGDNVRGSATAINIGSYNYIISQQKHEGVLNNFIFTEKARYHSKANKKIYTATYNHEVGLFVDCKDYYMEDYEEMTRGGKKRKAGF